MLASFSQKTTSLPHALGHFDVKRFLILVLLALLPIVFFSMKLFGLRVLAIILVAYAFGIGTEWLFHHYFKKPLNEGALVSCLLYALVLPPTLPLWMVALGVVVAILVGKALFGGLGRNILNPALVGRCFLHIAFPVQMTQKWGEPTSSIEMMTHASPIMVFKEGEVVSLWNLFWGNISGSVGETSAFLIIVGGFFLILTRALRWQIVVATLIGASASILIMGEKAQTLLPALLSGGFLFGAFFMATDPVTAPQTRKACWVYGLGIGALAMWIRYSSNYNEGIMFAILMMNALAPLIDKLMIQFVYKAKFRYAS